MDNDKYCPNCSAPMSRTWIVGEARRGGGYRIHCDACQHDWDDPKASYEDRRIYFLTLSEKKKRGGPRSKWNDTPKQIGDV